VRDYSLRALAPRIRAPVLETFCSEVVWGPKIFPLAFGVPIPAPRAELAACSDRTKSKEQRGGLALGVNKNVADATLAHYSASAAALSKLIAARSFCVKAESKLMLESRFALPSASFASTNAKAPLTLEHALDIPESLQGYRTMLPH
jgi:hypothetical protein